MGACFQVYKDKGGGFLEAVYQECMEIELEYQGLPFVAHPPRRLTYRGRELQSKYVPDLVCFDKIIVELKACSALTEKHEAQVLNYLHATGMQLGILVNFGHYPRLEYRRLALTDKGRRRPRGRRCR